MGRGKASGECGRQSELRWVKPSVLLAEYGSRDECRKPVFEGYLWGHRELENYSWLGLAIDERCTYDDGRGEKFSAGLRLGVGSGAENGDGDAESGACDDGIQATSRDWLDHARHGQG